LAEAGVQMDLRELPTDQILQAASKHDFDAFLVDAVSGPQVILPYLWWDSTGSMNPSGLGTAGLDLALDGVRKAPAEAEYRNAVAKLQDFIVRDPPGIFLAWGERARALSRRFAVPAEPGTDILGLLRVARPGTDERHTSQN
jgi:ABC-type transport system substrate-binding protein